MNRITALDALVSVCLLVAGCERTATVPRPATKPLEAMSRPSEEPHDVISIFDSSSLSPVDLAQNSPEAIRQELADSHYVADMANLLGLSKQDVAKLRVRYNTEYRSVELEDYGSPSDVLERMSDEIGRYVRWRNEGHTKQFVMASFRERRGNCRIDGLDLKPLLKKDAYIPMPFSLLRKQSTSISKINGRDRTCVTYVAMDGEIARVYSIILSPDGSPDECSTEIADAKEYDPKFRGIMDEIGKAVEAKMKKDRVEGLGSCHTFWRLKKEILKKRGIQWRSPAELNPNTHYD